MKTLADLLKVEARALEERAGHMVYLSYPYPCCLDEAMIHSRKYAYPSKGSMQIKHESKQTIIKLKPLKKSGRRKLFEIRLWCA